MKSYMNPAAADRFFQRELDKWPMAAANYAALADVETRQINVDGFTVTVQYNPARRVSTGAKVDKAAIAARPCFLCAANRPAEQGALRWGASFEVLVNPFPIFDHHFTIPEMAHTPQTVKTRGVQMVELARDLEEYAVFYNGARCGASAPDHMHFQAVPKSCLPLIAEIERRMPSTTDYVELHASVGFPFGFYVLDIARKVHPSEGRETLHTLYGVIDPWTDDADYMAHEPNFNVICYNTDTASRIIIIPRKQHRPDNYGDGPGQILLSPASVDLGGVFVTPRKEDFDSLTAADLRKVYQQLCYTEDDIIDVLDKI